ncbi:response regulator transcription factor [Pseudomonas sp. LS1212]|uniref:response regulator transcription factor n=1 Tax=Pseudomonas sp. LS1212 TaxID=2972478 RepID=UPI00215D5357|nr:response regulator transcription factor [Pseudomonas sp. LS1212]UVJ44586.1 response regulator transcription factor [Pseudomonas sp. LS1212]
MNKLTSQLKVLIVDDQPLIVDELCEFLAAHGYRCLPCRSSQQAIEFFTEDDDISLVLCDLHMPGLNGIELMQALKKIAGKQRPFETILLTRCADKQDVIKALREGFADYYQIPVDLNELLEGVNRQEAVLQERQKSYQQLGHLNQKLQYLTAYIDDLYQDLHMVRRRPSTDEVHAGLRQDQETEEIPAIFNQLSPRQLEVARLVGKGQTNYQIACELGITENTVKLYVSQVLRLTHMHNRTQLALALAPGSPGSRLWMTAH